MENFYFKATDLYMKYFGGYLGLDMVSFNVENESIALLGKSMSGKTTLLRCIAGLEKYSGSIDSNAKDLVFTFDLSSLKKNRTVKYNISLPLLLRKEQDIESKVLEKAKLFKIDDLLNKRVKDLSISEKRLVIICRALIRNADLYLLDDPLKDVENREEYFKILLNELKGKTVFYSTTELNEAKSFSKMLLMSYKKAIAFGSEEEILNNVKSIDTLKLLKNLEFENVELKKENDDYYIEYENIKYIVPKPISDIYVDKEVVFPKEKELILDMYFDKSTEYRISR